MPEKTIRVVDHASKLEVEDQEDDEEAEGHHDGQFLLRTDLVLVAAGELVADPLGQTRRVDAWCCSCFCAFSTTSTSA